MSYKNELARIVDGLVNNIFESERNRLKRYELELVKENSKVSGLDDKGRSLDGFFYQGSYYSDLAINLQAKGVKGPLHSSLAPKMDIHIADKREVLSDMGRVKQALVLLVRDCTSPQDLRDNLPNSLTDIIPEIKDLSRTRPEAYTLENNERAIRQYEKLRDKIQFYMAAKLLY